MSYGSKKIPITVFQKIIAKHGLKIKGLDVGVGKPVYITSDNIKNSATDNALVIDIYGGACAGTLYEMGTS